MAGRRTTAFAGILILAAGIPAMAQFVTPSENAAPPTQQPAFSNPNSPPQSSQPQFSNPNGGAQPQFSNPNGGPPPFGGFGAAQQQRPPCVDKIEALKAGAEKSAAALRAVQNKRPSPAEGCRLFTNFSGTFGAYVNYLAKEGDACGIPKDAVKGLRTELSKVNETKTKVCQIAAHPQGPAKPSLSGALSGPLPAPSAVKPGRGTYDTLTGNALKR